MACAPAAGPPGTGGAERHPRPLRVARRSLPKRHPALRPRTRREARPHGDLPLQRPRHNARPRIVRRPLGGVPIRAGADLRTHGRVRRLQQTRARPRVGHRPSARLARVGERPPAPLERGRGLLARRHRPRRPAHRVRAPPRARRRRAEGAGRGLRRPPRRQGPRGGLGHPRRGGRQPARPRARVRPAPRPVRLHRRGRPEDHEGVPRAQRLRRGAHDPRRRLEGRQGRRLGEGLQLQGRQAPHQVGGEG